MVPASIFWPTCGLERQSICTIIGGPFLLLDYPCTAKSLRPAVAICRPRSVYTVLRNGGGRYAYDVAHGHHLKDKKARKKVDDAWDELRAYQKAAGVAGNITNLRSAFTTDCA